MSSEETKNDNPGRGFDDLERSLIVMTFASIFLVGAYAVSRVNIVLAGLSLAVIIFLWYGVHRVRLCNFCDISCPYRPQRKSMRFTRMGFSTSEAWLFYPLALIIIGAYIIATFMLNIAIGILASALGLYALVLYRVKICPNCRIPCPFNPRKNELAKVRSD
ncbi:MAG TPA: hypothetical protein VGK02_04010 [Candidatus Aquicultor sp.]|jgi:hypothetical protein